jgi:hypothetical protein
MDKDILSENNITPISTTEKTSCDIIQKNILMNDNKQSQKDFNLFIKNISQFKRLTFIDKTVLWSLLQINLRPDLSSPTSKMQILIKANNEEKYYNSYTRTSKGFPYLFLLEHILKEYKSKYSLLDLTKIFDEHFNYKIYVSKGLETFLDDNKNKILESSVLKKHYVRGDEILKENEKLPRIQITSIIKRYLKTKKRYQYKIGNYLFTYDKGSSFSPQCNFDMDLYKNSIFLIHNKQIKSHIFAYKFKQNAFLATSDQDLREIHSLRNTPLFQGTSNTRSAAICSFKNKFKTNNSLWLSSTFSRDPGQHLFHLMEYGLNSINTIKELDTMLRFSRHQFLKDPVRLVIESRRSSKSQLNDLLKLNIPIYNSKKLGQIWGYFQANDQSSFILDDRREGNLECTSM